MTISVHRVNTMCDDNEMTTKRWAPFSPPDDFDVADAVSRLMGVGYEGGQGGGGRGGELRE